MVMGFLSRFVDSNDREVKRIQPLVDAANALERAVRAALAAGVRTADIGGTTGTREAAAWVAEHVAAS